MNLYDQPLHKLNRMLAQGECSLREIAQAYIDRTDSVEDRVKSMLHRIDAETILRRAEEAEKIRQAGQASQLTGIPYGLKDNLVTEGLPTTCASKILAGYLPPYNATVVERLNRHHANLAGKLNMDEFAMGSSTERSAFQQTANPWDIRTVPGGSSGGSAAAVAAGEVAYALGSDTGGSIRQPAAFCGVVGLKPTYGRVSRYGLVAFASSLDQIGPLTRDVTDAAIVLNAIAGHDPKDTTSSPDEVPDFTESLHADVRGLKIGVPREYFAEGIDPEVKGSVMAAIDLFDELGASVEECSLPHTRYALATYYLIAPAEASSNLSRFDGVRYGNRAEGEDFVSMYKKTRGQGFGAEVKRRIMLGTYALSAGYYDAYYKKAQQVRTLIRAEFDRAFEKFDVLVTPTTPTPAFRLGDRITDPLAMYMTDTLTIPANLAGIPAISIPCGFVGGLPVGLQIMGRAFEENTILRAAYTFEQNTDFHKRRPPLGPVGTEVTHS